LSFLLLLSSLSASERVFAVFSERVPHPIKELSEGSLAGLVADETLLILKFEIVLSTSTLGRLLAPCAGSLTSLWVFAIEPSYSRSGLRALPFPRLAPQLHCYLARLTLPDARSQLPRQPLSAAPCALCRVKFPTDWRARVDGACQNANGLQSGRLLQLR
jgi:hypothetical protein